MKFIPGKDNYDERPDEWFHEESTKIVPLPDGENVAVPMTNWHWRTWDWLCTAEHATIGIITKLASDYSEEQGIGLPESLQATIESYLDSVEAFQAREESGTA